MTRLSKWKIVYIIFLIIRYRLALYLSCHLILQYLVFNYSLAEPINLYRLLVYEGVIKVFADALGSIYNDYYKSNIILNESTMTH